ncbi:MAG: iron ABC transporter permease [Chloroflexi bacterium]|nr:iron ABC transporter permease [Chloroflexota bacterium]
MKKSILLEKLSTINLGGLVLRVFLVWFVIAFLIYPNANILLNVFYKNGEFSTEVFGKLFSSERAMRSLFNSFVLAISLTISVNVVGTLLVLFTEYFDIKGAKILKAAYLTTLIYGGIVLCTGYKFIYGETGLMTKFLVSILPGLDPTWFKGYWAVMFIMTFACTSNHMIFLTNAVRAIDYQVIEAARNLGASFGTIMARIILPLLKPTFFAISILTFLTGLSALSAPLIVGGSEFQTINPMIITFASSTYSREIAALLAIILGIATILLLTVMNKIEKGGTFISIAKTKSKMTKQKIETPVANALAHGLAYLLFLIYATPIGLVVIYSFTQSVNIKTGVLAFENLTIENYVNLVRQPDAFKPYLVSMLYSIFAAIGVAAIAIAVSRLLHKSSEKLASLLEYSMLIPWLLPSSLIAVGLMLSYDAPNILVGNNVLIGTAYILLLGYIVVKLPFSLRMIKAAFFAVESSLEEAAQCLGASAIYTFRRVILPIILPSVLAVIVLNANSLLADYDLTVFLYHPLLQTLGIVIKAASDETATVNAQAMSFVYAVILMVIAATALYVTRGREDSAVKS